MSFPSFCRLTVGVLFLITLLPGQSIPPGALTPHSGEIPVTFTPRSPIQQASMGTPPDPHELQAEANQLLELCQAIPADFQAIGRGVLPKDTIEKLRRIEKLSKDLRSKIGR